MNVSGSPALRPATRNIDSGRVTSAASGEADRDPDAGKPGRVLQDETHHAARGGAERDADADLRGAPAHRVRDRRVEADDREPESGGTQRAEHRRADLAREEREGERDDIGSTSTAAVGSIDDSSARCRAPVVPTARRRDQHVDEAAAVAALQE